MKSTSGTNKNFKSQKIHLSSCIAKPIYMICQVFSAPPTHCFFVTTLDCWSFLLYIKHGKERVHNAFQLNHLVSSIHYSILSSRILIGTVAGDIHTYDIRSD